MKEYRVIRVVVYGGVDERGVPFTKQYNPGETIKLYEDAAGPLLEVGSIGEIEVPAAGELEVPAA